MDNLEKEKLINTMREIVNAREKELLNMKDEEYIDPENICIRDIKYLGKYTMNETVKGKEELVSKDVFLMIEDEDGEFKYIYYDEDKNILGYELAWNLNILASKDLLERNDISFEDKQKVIEGIKLLDKNQAISVDEMEKENEEFEQEKQEKISRDLSEKSKQDDIEITKYKRITDKVFMSEFAETCSGAKEIGIAYSKSLEKFIMVADYGNGFEIAKGTEPAKTTMVQMYTFNEKERTSDKESPHALMTIKENSVNQSPKRLAISFDQYGYIETRTVDRAPDGKYLEDKDVATEGKSRTEVQPTKQQIEKDNQLGTDKTRVKSQIAEFDEQLEIDDNKFEKAVIEYANAKGYYIEGSRTIDIEKAREELKWKMIETGKDVDEIVKEADEEVKTIWNDNENLRK